MECFIIPTSSHPRHDLQSLPHRQGVPLCPLTVFDSVTCFFANGMWAEVMQAEARDVLMLLGCAFVLHPWEEMPQIAQELERNVDQSLAVPLPCIQRDRHPSNAQKWGLIVSCFGVVCYTAFHGNRWLIQMPVLQVFFNINIYYFPKVGLHYTILSFLT